MPTNTASPPDPVRLRPVHVSQSIAPGWGATGWSPSAGYVARSRRDGAQLAHYRDVDRVSSSAGCAMRAKLLGRVQAGASRSRSTTGIATRRCPTTSDTVASLVLCTVPDQASALATIKRLLKPDGRLLFLEHVRSPGLRGRVQSVVTPVWSRTAGAGCHLDRPTLDAIRAAGFAITDCHRSGALVQGTAVPSNRFPT